MFEIVSNFYSILLFLRHNNLVNFQVIFFNQKVLFALYSLYNLRSTMPDNTCKFLIFFFFGGGEFLISLE